MESECQIKVKKEKSLPPNITTPKRGPLHLSCVKSTTSSTTESTFKDTGRPNRSTPIPRGRRSRAYVKRGYLTRYPVDRVPPRPMDVIEGHLEHGMTWSQLKYNVQLIQEEMSRSATENRLGEGSETSLLHHRMKYSSHGNDPLASIERYTHIMSSGGLENQGNINVSITCDRQRSSLLTQHLTDTISCSDAVWKGHSAASLSKDPKPTDQVKAPHSSLPVSSATIFCRTNFERGSREHERSLSPPAEKEKPTNETFAIATSTKPHKFPTLYLSSRLGSSIVPQSVRALVTQRLRPITSNTMIKGRGLVVGTK